MLPISSIYLRPLLEIHKDDLITYLRSRNLLWMDDSSNLSRVYTRNKIRHDIIPPLCEIAGGNEALFR